MFQYGSCWRFCFRSSPRANITLSGKKKRKLLKQLQHLQQEKAGMEGTEKPPLHHVVSSACWVHAHTHTVCRLFVSRSVEVVAAPPKKKQESSSAPSKKKKKSPPQDVEMADME